MKKTKHRKGLSGAYIFLIIFLIIIFAIMIFFYVNSHPFINSDKMLNESLNQVTINQPQLQKNIFSFFIKETGEPIDGELIANGKSLGNTENGNISIPDLDSITNNFTLLAIYNNTFYNLNFKFSKNYNNYSEYKFAVTQEELRIIYLHTHDDFYLSDEPHWRHMPLSYKFNGTRCMGVRYDNLINAFNEIRIETNNSVSFIEIKDSEIPDITINCFQRQKEDTGYRDISGEGYYIETFGDELHPYPYDNIINQSTINLYSTLESCGVFPFIEIHELLHALGFNHNYEDSCSVMRGDGNCQYFNYKCNHKIDDNITKELIVIYG